MPGRPPSRQLRARGAAWLLGAAAGVAAAAAVPGGAPPAGAAGPASAPAVKAITPAAAGLVDINSASARELRSTLGVSEAEAKAIVAHRPYLTKADIVTHGVLPQGRYVALKDKMVAVQKAAPRPPAAAPSPQAAPSGKPR